MSFSINPEYTFNFSEKEKKDYEKQKSAEWEHLSKYQKQLTDMVNTNSEAIFANYDPAPFSVLDVKYTINRLAKNDPTLTHLPFGHGDPVNGNSDAIKIAKAIQTNTHCKSFELAECGFTDAGAILILQSLKNKEASIDLRGNKLTDSTFEHAAEMMASKDNHWESLSFGAITPSESTKKMLDANPKIKYQYQKAKENQKPADRDDSFRKLIRYLIENRINTFIKT